MTLSDGTTTLVLPIDLYWSDRNAWAPVEQVAERSVTGAMIVQSQARVAGRPITLNPSTPDSAWMSLSSVTQLKTWAAIPLQQLTLSIVGESHTVIFRHQDGALEASPVVFYNDEQSDDNYTATLRFMEI